MTDGKLNKNDRTPDSEDLRQECDEAFQKSIPYHRELDEIHDYYMPFRRPIMERSDRGKGSEGSSRGDLLFDGTAPSAAMTFTGSVHADWFPLAGPIWKLKTGPLITDPDLKKRYDEELGRIGNVTSDVALSPQNHAQTQESFADLFAGTCALFNTKGDANSLVETQAVPVHELALVEGARGRLTYKFWKRKFRYRDIEHEWEGAKISDEMARKIKEKPRDMTDVVQAVVYDPRDKVWAMHVWAACDPKSHLIIPRKVFSRDPMIVGRYFKVPGEAFGRGLAHLGLPFVKTLNKAREYALTAAAYAVLGIFTRRNEAAFNPDTVRFEPGAMWTVGSNGGSMGPSIQRLPIPQDFDISTVVIEDERRQVKEVLMEDDMVDVDDTVRSPTEITARLRRHAKKYGGVNARIASEIIAPYCQSIIDIGQDAGWIKASTGEPLNITINNLIVKMQIVAPAMAVQAADRVDSAAQYLQMVTMLLGPQAPLLASRVKELIPDMGRWMGVEEKYLPSGDEIEKLIETLTKAAMAAQAAAGEAKAPPADPRQQYMNGAM